MAVSVFHRTRIHPPDMRMITKLIGANLFIIILFFTQHSSGAVVHNIVLSWAGGTDECANTGLSDDYACNAGSDPGDWSNGIKYFTDSQTDLSYVVTQVNASIQGSFDCYMPVNVTILLNQVPVGYITTPLNSDPWCAICSNSWMAQVNSISMTYPHGWPSYVYGHINEASLLLDGGTIDTRFCLSRLTLNITYDHLPPPESSSSNDHFELDAPTWFWTLVILVGVIVMVLIIVFFTLWRRSSQASYNSMGYRPVSTHEYVDPSQLEDLKIDSDQLELKQEIGRGSFGQVFKGTWRGTEVAIKRIPANCIKESDTRDFMKEAFILRQLRHPNVLQVLGASMNPPCIVTEYMPRGNLFQLIHDRNVPLPWSMIRKIALDVCKGMSYLHGCTPPLIHRDLKPHNLLVDENWRVKVCDFGLSKFVDSKHVMTACGTPAYAAPEVLRNSDYSMSADVYSFAIVLWELVTRDILYPNLPPFQIIFAVGTQRSRPPIPAHLNKAIANLIQECWDEDPNTRPSFLVITDRLTELGDSLVLMT